MLHEEDRLQVLRERIEGLMRDKVSLLRNECDTVSSDMEALVLRLSRDGCEADIGDIKSARWYRTASEIRMLRQVYQMVCDSMGLTGAVVAHIVPDEDSDTFTTTDQDAPDDK